MVVSLALREVVSLPGLTRKKMFESPRETPLLVGLRLVTAFRNRMSIHIRFQHRGKRAVATRRGNPHGSSAPRKATNKKEQNGSQKLMKKLLLITLMIGGLAFVPAQR